MGLAPLTLWLACLLAVRNQRILTAWDARQADERPPRRGRAAARKPAAAAARPSPASPPQRRHNPSATHPATVTGTPQITPDQARRTQPAAQNSHAARQPALNPAPAGNTPGAHAKCQTQT